MSKVRVYELAKELGQSNKDVIEQLRELGVEVKSHSSSVDDDVAAKLKLKAAGNGPVATAEAAVPAEAAAPVEAPAPAQARIPADAQAAEPKAAEPKAAEPAPPQPAPAPADVSEPAPAPADVGPPVVSPTAVLVHRGVTVKDFAEKVGRPPTDIVKALMRHGAMKSVTQSMADEEVLVVADDLGLEVEVVDPGVEERLEGLDVPVENLESRPPVVTVMGHVDHGKTTVLDRIRVSDVVAQEHGGITQHIGAYQVTKDGQRITFIDTPGHQAFTAMRARGAQVTDVAILVVAADDGVMPQTVEAMDHAKAAGVPIIVAVNKIDKPEADPTRVRTELTDHGLQPQEWGGDTLFVDMSAKTGDGLDDLLTSIILMSEELELKAAPDGPARGVILEAHLDKGRGPVATVLVRSGKLHVGDAVVAGSAWGKVRAMLDEYGDEVDVADPSRPVLVLGWNSVPQAGDDVRGTKDEKEARSVGQGRTAARRHAEMVAHRPAASLEELLREFEELRIVLKADVQGSLEALADGLTKLDLDEAKINIIHRSVGAIGGSDVTLARASGAIIVGFNVRPDAMARQEAEREGVDIRYYRVIYEAIDDIERSLRGMLAPERREVVLGAAEVRETFRIPRGMAAGCYVTHGEILRNAGARLVRDGRVVYEGKIQTLRRFKEDVRDVSQGYECGITLEDFADVHVGDVIEAFEVREISRV